MVKNTFQLINSIKKMYPVVEFFHNRYFPDSRTFYSDKVLIETKRQGRMIAPFVIPVVGGIKMENEGYRAQEFEAPYIAPYNTITPQDLAMKAFGESPDSNRSPADRENELQGERMDELRLSILRRQESMCTELVTTGEIVMKHYASAEDAANDKNAQVKLLRFFDAEEGFGNRYAISGDFTKMTAQEKIMELYKIASILSERCVKATDIVMTSDVSMLLMSDQDFLEYYNKRNVDMGKIDQMELPEGVVCNGIINVNGIDMTMFTYDEFYESLGGEITRMLPRGTMAFMHPNLGETVYGQVTFLKGDSFESHAEKIVPRVLSDEKNNVIKIQEFSRPVPYVYDWDAWVVTNIYEKPDGTPDTNQKEELPDAEGKAAGKPELKTAEEINAMTKKQDVIDYALSIGMEGLTSDSNLTELKEAVLNYQEETFGGQ